MWVYNTQSMPIFGLSLITISKNNFNLIIHFQSGKKQNILIITVWLSVINSCRTALNAMETFSF